MTDPAEPGPEGPAAPPPLRPWTELRRSGQLAQFTLLCLGIWLHAADATLIATLIPDAVGELGGVTLVGWTLALYIAGSIVAGAATGLIVQRIGLRHALCSASLVFAAGCAVSALAPNMEIVLAGRLVQGLGGGALVALAYVAAQQLFSPRLIPPLMAVISAVWGGAVFVGPLIGGVFAEAGHWRLGFWAFALQAAMLAATALIFVRPVKLTGAVTSVPWRRLALLTAGILAIAAGGIEPHAPSAALLLAGGLALLVWFVRRDAQAGANALFPSNLTDMRSVFGAGAAFIFFLALASIGFGTYGPLLLNLLHGVGPLQAGYLIALESLAWSVVAIAVAGAAARHEPNIIRGGALLITLGIAGMALTLTDGPLAAILPFIVALGAGFGLSWATVVKRVMEAAPPAEAERSSAALPTIQLAGYALGAALTGLVANRTGLAEGATKAAAEAATFWIFAAFIPLALLGCLAAFRLAKLGR